MAWVHQVPVEDASGRLKKIYEDAHERAGGVANILRVMSQRPRSLANMMTFYVAEMHGASELSRDEREMLATVTSWVNECFY